MMIIGSILIGVGIGLFIPEFMEFTHSKGERFKHNAKMMTIALIILAMGLGIQIHELRW